MRLCHRRSFRTETPLGHLIVAISHTSIERILEVSVLGVHQTFEVGILDLQAGPLLVRIIKLVGHAPAFQLVLFVSVLNLLDGLDHTFPLCLCHLSVAAWQVILLLHFNHIQHTFGLRDLVKSARIVTFLVEVFGSQGRLHENVGMSSLVVQR